MEKGHAWTTKDGQKCKQPFIIQIGYWIICQSFAINNDMCENNTLEEGVLLFGMWRILFVIWNVLSDVENFLGKILILNSRAASDEPFLEWKYFFEDSPLHSFASFAWVLTKNNIYIYIYIKWIFYQNNYQTNVFQLSRHPRSLIFFNFFYKFVCVTKPYLIIITLIFF